MFIHPSSAENRTLRTCSLLISPCNYLSIHQRVCPSVCFFFYLSVCISVRLSVLSVYQHVCLSVSLSFTYPSACVSLRLSFIYLSVFMSVRLSVLSVYQHVCFYPSVYLLPIYQCVCWSVCLLSVYQRVCLYVSVLRDLCSRPCVCLCICPSFCLSLTRFI